MPFSFPQVIRSSSSSLISSFNSSSHNFAGRLPLFNLSNNKTSRFFSCSKSLQKNILISQGILGSKKNQLVPLKTQIPGIITWYACGPTVYDSAHIGHASSYIRLDVIRRILESRNVSVLQVMGVTDIDDKIIARANQLKIPWNELSRKYEIEFFSDLEKFNILMPHAKARVSNFVTYIIEFVAALIEKGLAYPTSDGSVYFDTKKYGKYGKFCSVDSDSSFSEEEQNLEKRNPKDFAVWKGRKPGEPFWETSWGTGRPGWHIECSVMASYFFGEKLDLHSGGMDLIFPHHENEEAQCCAKFGHDQWVNNWIHTGHLIVRGDVKMSKSLSNTITIDDFLRDNSSDVLRMMCIMSPYSNNIEFSDETKNLAGTVLKKIETFIGNCSTIISGQQIVQQHGLESELWSKLLNSKNLMSEALENNFDTPKALGILIDHISDFNRNIRIANKSTIINCGTNLSYVMNCKQFVENFIKLLGFGNSAAAAASYTSEILVEEVLNQLIEFRKVVRNYSIAQDESNKTERKLKVKERQHLLNACDTVRNNLKAVGIEIKDQAEDSNWSITRRDIR